MIVKSISLYTICGAQGGIHCHGLWKCSTWNWSTTAQCASCLSQPWPHGAPQRQVTVPQQPQPSMQQHPSPHHQPTPQNKIQLTPALANQSIGGDVLVYLNFK